MPTDLPTAHDLLFVRTALPAVVGSVEGSIAQNISKTLIHSWSFVFLTVFHYSCQSTSVIVLDWKKKPKQRKIKKK